MLDVGFRKIPDVVVTDARGNGLLATLQGDVDEASFRTDPRVRRSTRRKMLVANQDARTKLHQDSEQTGGWVGAARVIADVFLERFFATIRVHDARFDDYLRHWPTVLF